MRRLIYRLLMTFLVCQLFGCLWGQSKWQSGLFIGGANYQGDLVETLAPILSETGYSVGVINRYNWSDQIRLRAHFIFGKISGTDLNATEGTGRRKRNFSFESQISELAFAFEYEPFPYKFDSSQTKRLISPYIYTGIGGSNFNVSNQYNSSNGLSEEIRADQEATKSNLAAVVPVGGGIKFNVNKHLELGVEVGTRLTFSDYVDGVSFSGNPESNDWYWYGGVNVGIKFLPKDIDDDGIADKGDECPEIKGLASTSGCPDTDGDGIADKLDWCPNEFGIASLEGCPDTDLDGIADAIDDCPKDFGLETTNGCPDNDADAIPDHLDQCPKLAGTVIGKGCPILDANGDGSIKEELEAQLFLYPPIVREIIKTQSSYWWIKNPEIWLYFQW